MYHVCVDDSHGAIMEQGRQTVADRVRTLRDQRGWSLAQLAGRASIDPSTIWKIENGRTPNPGNLTLGKIASALGVSLQEITGERPMPRRRVEISEGVARLPLRRLRVQADGEPAWMDTEDTIVVGARKGAGRPNAFAAAVSGSCMVPHVWPGEIVLIDPDQRPLDRDMVVVTTDHGDTLVKWYRFDDDGQPYLRAADGTVMRPDSARLEGVVFRVERDAIRDPE